MNLRVLSVTGLLFAGLLTTGPAAGLTMNQFVRICESAELDCSDHPILQAYVGGALDMIAMLDEETGYLAQVYCKPTDELFDVPAIIQYMEAHQTEYADKNAMLVVIDYFEVNGGCQ